MDERKLFAFTETVIFTEDLLKIADDETLYAVQNALLTNPLLGDVIKQVERERDASATRKQSRAKAADFVSYIFICREMKDFIF